MKTSAEEFEFSFLYLSFFKLDLRKTAQAQQSVNYIGLGRSFISSLLTLTLPISLMCSTVTAGKQTVLFFIFITALKSIGDSRLDEHEAFLQLPCRCRRGKHTLNLNE